jgi:hypothetical protein
VERKEQQEQDSYLELELAPNLDLGRRQRHVNLEEPTGIHPALPTRPRPRSPARPRSCSTTGRPSSVHLFQPPPPEREHRDRLALEYLFTPLFRFVQLVIQLDREKEMANTAISRRPARRGHRRGSLGIFFFIRSNDLQER